MDKRQNYDWYNMLVLIKIQCEVVVSYNSFAKQAKLAVNTPNWVVNTPNSTAVDSKWQ